MHPVLCFCLCLSTNTYQCWWLFLDFHRRKGNGRCFTLEEASYRGVTAGPVPRHLLMRLTFVDDERTAELTGTWWLQTNNGRVSGWATAPLPSSRNRFTTCCHLQLWRQSSLLWDGKRGEQLFLDYGASKVKSFAAPPAAASLSYVSKCRHRGRLGTAPRFVTRWFMIIVLPWHPGALWCTKLVFPPPFLFSLFL